MPRLGPRTAPRRTPELPPRFVSSDGDPSHRAVAPTLSERAQVPVVTSFDNPPPPGARRETPRSRTLLIKGEVWIVREETRGQYDRRSRPDLVFESAAIVRRVRDYPDDWLQLPDAELMSVSNRR